MSEVRIKKPGETADTLLRIYRGAEDIAETEREPDPDGRSRPNDSEDFWAGRNYAMRRSARVAA